MGSLENGVNKSERTSFLQRPSSMRRLLIVNKLDYLLWICSVTVFLFLVILFQMFLPGSVVEKKTNAELDHYGDLRFVKELGLLDFGEDVMFQPSRPFDKFRREGGLSLNRTMQRFGLRKPQLALVFADLLIDSHQVQMVTVAAALQEIGYELSVYSLEDGPARKAWKSLGVTVTIIQTCDQPQNLVDWLNFNGILVSSLEAKVIFSCFVQEPFKSLPVIWTIHEEALAAQSRKYSSSSQIELLNDWKRVFNRSTIAVFPNYFLPMIYTTFDAGNFFVIPGSPTEACKADSDSIVALDIGNVQGTTGKEPENVVLTIVGSKLMYRGLWLEHSIVLRALLPLLEDFLPDNNSPRLKINVLSGDSTSNYSSVVEAIAYNLNYPSGIVKHAAIDVDADNVLSASHLVIYGSFLEEQ